MVIPGRRTEVLERAREEIDAAVGAARVVPVGVDLTYARQVEAAARRIAPLGPVDVLVNNAGAVIPAPADESLPARRPFNGGAVPGR
ncbi:SDR family NAD(P)-dependent oxidoreductase [Kitasatospora sp. RB6PN24]|uniref:SDR family NAD(P)-dependent oxidoreductase n=1 Tax=Kitasatospora humi TaxID=2893891 RepID=UPI001E458C82|nr:SDR family NAD(P)-dependent oxidoreductase [Kitasatospora humi]MCC9307856.1 SDR family NAD(P)-dependent oxidoreductase [Kitasatospora humi]